MVNFHSTPIASKDIDESRIAGTGALSSPTLRRCVPDSSRRSLLTSLTRQSEKFSAPAGHAETSIPIAFDATVHGTSGPITTSYPPFLATSFNGFYTALRGMGIRVVIDPNSGQNAGLSLSPSSIDPTINTRVTSDAYRKP